ncbi:MAG: cache domain-containing protein [Pseudobdellovibrionaceae bacterium]|nr:cache domain-containing protein [Pseudobdellovibrionaceae bacterium]
MLRLRQPYSLSWHLVALVLAAMIPFFIFSDYMVGRLVSLERQAGERSLRREAQKLRISVDQEFKTSIRTLQALGASASLQRNDLEAFHEDMLRVKDSQPSWETISLYNAAGEVVLASSRDDGRRMEDGPKPESIQKVIAIRQPIVGTVTRAPEGSKFANPFAFPVQVPVFDKDKVIFVLAAIVSVELLQTLVMESSAQEEWTRTIVDGRVQWLLAPAIRKLLLASRGRHRLSKGFMKVLTVWFAKRPWKARTFTWPMTDPRCPAGRSQFLLPLIL